MELLSMARYRKRKMTVGRFVRRKTGSKFAGNVAQTAMAGYRLAKRVARLINTEIKTYGSDAQTQKNYAGTIIDLCDPAQGDGQEERVGNQIKPLHLTIRGGMYADSTGGVTQQLRVIIFRYKDENGSALTVNDILDNDHVGTTRAVIACKEFDNRYHSKFLYDKTFILGKATAGSDVPNYKHFKFSTKLYGHINWTNSTTTQEGGGLYMLVISDQAADADSPVLSWVSRVTYTDN